MVINLFTSRLDWRDFAEPYGLRSDADQIIVI